MLKENLFIYKTKKCNSKSLDKGEREYFSNVFDLFAHDIFLNSPLGHKRVLC